MREAHKLNTDDQTHDFNVCGKILSMGRVDATNTTFLPEIITKVMNSIVSAEHDQYFSRVWYLIHIYNKQIEETGATAE
jgi:hypothetical protein